MRWADVDRDGKALIRTLLLVPRGRTRSEARQMMEEHMKTCRAHSPEEHVLFALKIAEQAEDAIDAALAALGLD